MPFVYFGTGWLIGIWAASALQLPTEAFFALTIVLKGNSLDTWNSCSTNHQ